MLKKINFQKQNFNVPSHSVEIPILLKINGAQGYVTLAVVDSVIKERCLDWKETFFIFKNIYFARTLFTF